MGYRKARKGQNNCGECASVRKVKIPGIGNADLGEQYRCVYLGLKSSAKYRVRPDHVCNEFALDIARIAESRPEPR